jgi:hypothetical protein
MLQRDAGLRGKEGSKGRAVAAFKAKGEKDRGGKEGVRGWGPGWRHNGVARGGTNLRAAGSAKQRAAHMSQQWRGMHAWGGGGEGFRYRVGKGRLASGPLPGSGAQWLVVGSGCLVGLAGSGSEGG